MSETILAIIAACAIIAAVLMTAFAYRLNEKWAERNAEWADLCDNEIAEGIHRSNEKARERGLLDR